MMDEKRCKICQHKQLTEIERDLVHGLSENKIAVKYGFSRSVVVRHKRHMINALVSTPEKAETTVKQFEEMNLLDEIQFHLQHTKNLMLTNKATISISAAKEYRGAIELLAKLSIQLEKWQHTKVTDSPEWWRIRTIILNILDDYPEAKDKLKQKLREVDIDVE